MTQLSVVDTSLEGFRLTRERPLAVLAWGGVLVAGQAGAAAVLIGSGAGAALRKAAVAPGAAPDPAAQMAVLSAAAPGLVLAALVSVAAQAVVLTAVLRVVLAPEQRRYAFLRLGIEELRQFALAVLGGFLISVGGATLAAVLVAPAAAFPPAQAALATPLALALAAAAVTYPAVRLSLAPALTFADGRFSFVRAWPLSRGLFWTLFGVYGLALVLALVVSVMTSFLVTALWGLATGQGMAAAATLIRPELASWSGAASASSLAAVLVNGGVTGLVLTILAAPAPLAYRLLTGRGPSTGA